METLKECLRNRPIPVKIVAEYKSSKGTSYCLCKTDENKIHYFMEGNYVVKKESFDDDLEKLYLNLLNKKDIDSTLESMNKLKSYKRFKMFVKERSGEELR